MINFFFDKLQDIRGKTYNAFAFETKNPDGLFKRSGICIDIDGDRKCTPEEQFYDGDTVELDGERYHLKLNYP